MRVFYLDYEDIITNPQKNAADIQSFLSVKLDIKKMAAVIKC
jgi:hypothetical protein